MGARSLKCLASASASGGPFESPLWRPLRECSRIKGIPFPLADIAPMHTAASAEFLTLDLP